MATAVKGIVKGNIYTIITGTSISLAVFTAIFQVDLG